MAPIAIIAATSILGAVGTAVSAMSTYQAGQFNAKQNQISARIATQQAAQDELAQRKRSRFVSGLGRANQGASGLLAEGSFLDIMEDNAVNDELDALTIRHQGALRARSFMAQAELDKSGARNALISGAFGVGSSLLGIQGRGGGTAGSRTAGFTGTGRKPTGTNQNIFGGGTF